MHSDDCPCFDCKINRYIAFLWSVDYIWDYIRNPKDSKGKA